MEWVWAINGSKEGGHLIKESRIARRKEKEEER